MSKLTKLSVRLARSGPDWWFRFWTNVAHWSLNRAAKQLWGEPTSSRPHAAEEDADPIISGALPDDEQQF